MKTNYYRFTALMFIFSLMISCAEEKPLSTENKMLSFAITKGNFSKEFIVSENSTGIITARLPEFIDLKNLNIDWKYSKDASISPDPNTIKDYSSPINFTVKSESGIEKIYQIKLKHMDIDRLQSCSEANAWKWFGGDNRTETPSFKPYDRNVGTGQTIKLDKDLVPSRFSIHLREGFSYNETKTQYNKTVTLKLIIRDKEGKILTTTTTDVLGEFNGGFIPFYLEKSNLLLEAGKTYIFYWFLVNGESLGVTAGSSGNTKNGTGFCFESGYSGESKISTKTNLDELNTWWQHPWHFNIELEGKE